MPVQTGIQHLALEIFEQIVLYSSYQWNKPPSKAALCNLRLICQQFKHAVDPILFSKVGLNFNKRALNEMVLQLQKLADGVHPGCGLAKELRILHHEKELTETPCSTTLVSSKFGQLLMGAVKALRNVRSVYWLLHDIDWIPSLIDGLAEIPHIERLHLHFYDFSCKEKLQIDGLIPLHRLPTIRQLTIGANFAPIGLSDDFIQQLRNLPHITSSFTRLELSVPFRACNDRCLLHEILQDVPKESRFDLLTLPVDGWSLKLDSITLPHLRSLSSLNICQMQNQDGVPEIWDRLNAASIHLEDIVTRDTSPQLVNYLTSYSGLKRFELRRKRVRRTRADAESCADIYQVFPIHKGSLVTLRLLERRNIQTFITIERLTPILLCKKLSFLSLIVRTEELDDITSMKQILINAIELPSLLTLEVNHSVTRRRTVSEKLERIITAIDIQKDLPAGLPFRDIIVCHENRYIPGFDVEDSCRKFIKVEPLVQTPARRYSPFS